MADGERSEREIETRRATAAERDDVLGVLDGANLETDPAAIRSAVDRDAVFVAEPADDDRTTLLGALVLDGDEITHVAVRRRRRGQGIGTALVRAAAEDRGALTAAFDSGVEPFYAALGFEIDPVDGEEGRFRGRGPADPR